MLNISRFVLTFHTPRSTQVNRRLEQGRTRKQTLPSIGDEPSDLRGGRNRCIVVTHIRVTPYGPNVLTLKYKLPLGLTRVSLVQTMPAVTASLGGGADDAEAQRRYHDRCGKRARRRHNHEGSVRCEASCH